MNGCKTNIKKHLNISDCINNRKILCESDDIIFLLQECPSVSLCGWWEPTSSSKMSYDRPLLLVSLTNCKYFKNVSLHIGF